MKVGSGNSRLKEKIAPGDSRACGASQNRVSITDYEMFTPTAENTGTRGVVTKDYVGGARKRRVRNNNCKFGCRLRCTRIREERSTGNDARTLL